MGYLLGGYLCCLILFYLEPKELHELYNAAETNPIRKTELSFNRKKFERLYRNRKTKNAWGWKEPNTQIFVSEILNFFPNESI